MSPYWDCDFIQYCFVFFQRMLGFVTGHLSLSQLATDELQVFVLCLIACSCALIGPFLVLKKITMLANSLSHTVLLGIVITFLFFHNEISHTFSLKALLFASLVTAVLTSFLTQFLTQGFKVQEDASVGLVFSGLFAAGIMLVTIFTKNAHFGAEAIMGNVDALHLDDLQLSFILFIFNLVVMLLVYRKYKLIAFDEKFAKTLKIATAFWNFLLMTQVAASIMGAFRAVGVLLVLAFIVAPYLTASLYTKKLKLQIFLCMFIGCICSFIGVGIARHLLVVYDCPLSTAGIVVCLLGCSYFLSYFMLQSKKNRVLQVSEAPIKQSTLV